MIDRFGLYNVILNDGTECKYISEVNYTVKQVAEHFDVCDISEIKFVERLSLNDIIWMKQHGDSDDKYTVERWENEYMKVEVE